MEIASSSSGRIGTEKSVRVRSVVLQKKRLQETDESNSETDDDDEEDIEPQVKKSRTFIRSPSKNVSRITDSVKARCSCGKDYNAKNGGWRTHLLSCKSSGIVTCLCGKVSANAKFSRSEWVNFNIHLEECSMEVDLGDDS